MSASSDATELAWLTAGYSGKCYWDAEAMPPVCLWLVFPVTSFLAWARTSQNG